MRTKKIASILILGYMFGLPVAIYAGSERNIYATKLNGLPNVQIVNGSGTLTLPGTTDTLVGRATTDTLTNKTLTAPTINGGDFDGETASNSNRITLPKADLTDLESLNRKEGTIFYAKDQAKIYFDDGAALRPVGSGGGDGGGTAGNLLANSDFEIGVGNWTASGGDKESVADAANVGFGAKSMSWDSDDALQTLTSDPVTITDGGGPSRRAGAASCLFKCSSGNCTHKIQAYDGTNVLAEGTITSTTDSFSRTSVSFSFPASGTASLRIVSVAADEPTLFVDQCYLGLAEGFNQGSADYITEWTSFTMTIGGSTSAPTKGTIVRDVARWRRVGDSMEIEYDFEQSAAGSSGSGTYLFPIPESRSVNTDKMPVSTTGETICGLAHTASSSDGLSQSSLSGFVFAYNSTNLAMKVLDVMSSNTISLVGSSAQSLGNTNAIYSFRCRVPIEGWSASAATHTFDTTAASWSGTSTLTGTTASTTFADPGSVSGAITQTAAQNMTVSAAASTLGISVTPAKAGMHKVCYTGSVSNTNADTLVTARLTDGSGNVIVGEQGGTIPAANGSIPVGGCGDYRFTSTSAQTFKMQCKTSANTATCNATSFSVLDISQSFPAPVVNNSVTSSSTWTERIERAVVSSTCTSSPCTIASKSGDWLSSSGITRTGEGAYTVTWANGAFSAAPTCVVSVYGGESSANAVPVAGGAPSGSSFSFKIQINGGADQDGSFGVICMGPR